ncbi:hypothetical protein [Aureimonas sp. N4]|uniref:hypothetical protein n=1 Tax=Aureimonas sp. N4 TaxID=1638165 RepID=UPI000B11D49F|nr:hypothetical protein [Aureimonas sp. N4]
MSGEEDFKRLLSEGLDLCVRARKMDAMDRRAATLACSREPDEWVASGQFDRYVEEHNSDWPDKPIATRSGTVALWLQEQYDSDLADWERRARHALMQASA